MSHIGFAALTGVDFAALFTAIILVSVLAVYLTALGAFFVWFVRGVIAENRRRRDWAVRLDRAKSAPTSSGFSSVDGSGNVRVIGGEQR